jgi:hypothetical protein
MRINRLCGVRVLFNLVSFLAFFVGSTLAPLRILPGLDPSAERHPLRRHYHAGLQWGLRIRNHGKSQHPLLYCLRLARESVHLGHAEQLRPQD